MEAKAKEGILKKESSNSPDLSLLILNKSFITIRISTFDFVWLEKTKVQLLEKDGKTVL
ncbi:hypothetical protein Ddye_026062, partial [Dipteronia dyeriana]